MVETINPNEVISGSHGRAWLNGELWANAISFEAKITGDYEEFDVAGIPGKCKKLQGFSGAGTVQTMKIDSRQAKLLAEGFKSGVMPECKIVARVADPNSTGQERVEFLGVTFDELLLISFELKKNIVEDIPFSFNDFNYLDAI